jgi:hypothetical protein
MATSSRCPVRRRPSLPSTGGRRLRSLGRASSKKEVAESDGTADGVPEESRIRLGRVPEASWLAGRREEMQRVRRVSKNSAHTSWTATRTRPSTIPTSGASMKSDCCTSALKGSSSSSTRKTASRCRTRDTGRLSASRRPPCLRVAQAMVQAAPNTITGLTWLRELSDGFQYKEVKDGETRLHALRRRQGR